MTKRRNFFKKSHIKSYEGRRFENPFFKKKKIKPWKKILLSLFFVGGIFGLVGYSIYGPLFTITTIEIQGLTTIPIQDVENAIRSKIDKSKFSIIPRDHSLFLKSNKITEELAEELDFETIELSSDRNSITIFATERISELVWRSDRSFYFIDFEGKIQREFRESELNSIFSRLNMPLNASLDGSEPTFAPLQPNVPIIEDKSKTSVEIENQVTNGKTVENVLEFDNALRRLSLIPIIYEIDSPNEAWLRVITTSNFNILFESGGDIEKQIKSLSVALGEYKDTLAEIQYIDIRFDGRVYIK